MEAGDAAIVVELHLVKVPQVGSEHARPSCEIFGEKVKEVIQIN